MRIMEKEQWKTIEDYQVSNLGKVKSLKGGKEKILKQLHQDLLTQR